MIYSITDLSERMEAFEKKLEAEKQAAKEKEESDARDI